MQAKKLFFLHHLCFNLESIMSNHIKDQNMDCNLEKNKKNCNCTYEPCSRKGACCACLQYHLKNRELPACCFSADAERTFDRSFEYFAQLVSKQQL
jgi:hypothetical protein